jgi:hypothetical protein
MRRSFGDLGVPIAALRGYASESLEAEVLDLVKRERREVVLFYVGDFDPTGEDIPRAFEQTTGLELHRVALTPEQVEEYELPPAPGKRTDTRAASFEARHGRLVQVELEALPPETLRSLVADALEPFLDRGLIALVHEREEEERARLVRLVKEWED